MGMDTASDQARFVPTLTEIVEVHPFAPASDRLITTLTDTVMDAPGDAEEAMPASALQGTAAAVQPMSEAVDDAPLVAVVPPDDHAVDLPAPESVSDMVALEAVMPAADHSAAASQTMWSEDLTEQMVHRVIQRVDAVLAQRVGEVIASVIEAQTRSLLPSIRQELEFAIRTSVHDAVADELSHMDEAIKTQV